ncbi:MAG: hypothetical protein OEZ04_13260, partial [Nitrospinota bacterium]|nr:hypothetical protein [Nitrospinota bacterium]
MNHKTPAAASLILFITVFALYWGTFHYPFQFDGISDIQENTEIRDITDPARILSFNPSRFVIFFSFAVNYAISGLDTFSYHILNTFVHAVNSILVYLLVSLILQAWAGMRGAREASPEEHIYPMLAAMIFAVHPLQTQAVTYIWQRSTSIGAMFYLASMLFYMKSAMEEKNGAPAERWRKYLALSLISGFLAMFSKQFSVTLPVAVAMLDFFLVSGSLAKFKQRLMRLAWFLPLLMIVPILTSVVISGEVSHIGVRSKNILSQYQYLITQFNVILLYLRLMVYPAGQNLDYDYPPSQSIIDSAPALAFLLGMAALAFWLYNRNRPASFGILFFFVAMSVESSFYPLEDLVFEHRVYLPFAGLLLAAASLLKGLMEKSSYSIMKTAALAGLVIAISAPLAYASHLRNQAWSTQRGLWEDIVEKSPGKLRGYGNLATFLMLEGDNDRAYKILSKANSIDPENSTIIMNLGLWHEVNGDLETAAKYYHDAIKRSPRIRLAPHRLANIMFVTKQYKKAALFYKLELEARPGNQQAMLVL